MFGIKRPDAGYPRQGNVCARTCGYDPSPAVEEIRDGLDPCGGRISLPAEPNHRRGAEAGKENRLQTAPPSIRARAIFVILPSNPNFAVGIAESLPGVCDVKRLARTHGTRQRPILVCDLRHRPEGIQLCIPRLIVTDARHALVLPVHRLVEGHFAVFPERASPFPQQIEGPVVVVPAPGPDVRHRHCIRFHCRPEIRNRYRFAHSRPRQEIPTARARPRSRRSSTACRKHPTNRERRAATVPAWDACVRAPPRPGPLPRAPAPRYTSICPTCASGRLPRSTPPPKAAFRRIPSRYTSTLVGRRTPQRQRAECAQPAQALDVHTRGLGQDVGQSRLSSLEALARDHGGIGRTSVYVAGSHRIGDHRELIEGKRPGRKFDGNVNLVTHVDLALPGPIRDVRDGERMDAGPRGRE